jgi:hypothetical protein
MNGSKPDVKIDVASPETHLEILLAEYAANVSLWQHDDNLRLKRTGTFLTFNAFLYGVLAFILKEKVFHENIALLITLASAGIGILVCVTWLVMHGRNQEYILFRRKQLAEIEAKLGGIADTFTQQRKAISLHRKISFEKSGESFETRRHTRMSSAAMEHALPIIFIIIWVILVVALVFFTKGATLYSL